MEMDIYDELVVRCAENLCYPCNLLRTDHLRSQLEAQQSDLEARQAELFIEKHSKVDFLELQDGEEGFCEKTVVAFNDLESQLFNHRKDPKCRFIFINTRDSRSALQCSRDIFTYIMTFHQVPATFLDFATSFGRSVHPIDYHLTGFYSDNNIRLTPDEALSIPRLGRSGITQSVQYLLRSVEPSMDMYGARTWNIRQMAVYHNFDFVSGKSLWINLKTNDLMQKRLKELAHQFSASSVLGNMAVCQNFATTLAIHLVTIEWCDAEWRQCINHFQGLVRKALEKAKTTRIDPKLPMNAAQRVFSMKTAQQPVRDSGDKTWAQLVIQKLPYWRHRRTQAATDLEALGKSSVSAMGNEKPRPISKNTDPTKQYDHLDTLENFKFSDIQHLHYLSEQLEHFRLVIELNDHTLRDLSNHYHQLMDEDGLPGHIRTGCAHSMAMFQGRLDRVRRNLEVRMAQIRSLISLSHDGKSLFDGILQYQGVQIGQFFAESSQQQQDQMAKIAMKTEKETISMHIITFVTLAFLPGTFLAAFFQSGLVEINKKAAGLSDAIVFHQKAFGLFASVCFPLMIFTFFAWIILFKCLSSRAEARAHNK